MITIKAEEAVKDRAGEATSTATGDFEFILHVNPDGGVSENRNACLRKAKGDTIIFIDDDLYEYPKGWNETLTTVLKSHSVLMAGPRLLNRDNSIQATVSKSSNVTDSYIEVDYIPGACMAYRKNGLLFNEEYKGWGMEDIQFQLELKKLNPAGCIYLCNNVKMVHANEMKNEPKNGKRNKELFRKKWGFVVE